MKLVKPNNKYKNSYLAACEEDLRSGNHNIIRSFEELNKAKSDFNAFINEKYNTSFNPGKILCEDGKYYDKVPQTSYWLIDNDDFIGQFDIRHYLSPFLLYKSGNISYSIIASHQRKGFATKGLALLLKEAKKLGLDRVMIAAKEENIGSWKTIENNGGILENIISMPWDTTNIKYKRYWITL